MSVTARFCGLHHQQWLALAEKKVDKTLKFKISMCFENTHGSFRSERPRGGELEIGGKIDSISLLQYSINENPIVFGR